MSARVVAFVNFKGGVGKTSNVVNLAAAIAAFHGKRVLVVDLDAQCSSSLWLMRKAEWREHTEDPARTTVQVFLDGIQGTDRFDPAEAIVRGVPRGESGFSMLENLDLLPASLDLLQVEERLSPKSKEPYFRFLSNSLKPLRDEYDYIFLDCPPSFHSVTKNALFFARDIVIPYIPDFLSLSGFQMFAGLIHDFGEQVAAYKVGRLKSGVAAVVVNRYQKTGNVYDEGIGQLQMLLAHLKAEGRVREEAVVLDPPIRNCVRVAESPDRHLPVVLHAPMSIGSEDYFALSGAMIEHLSTL